MGLHVGLALGGHAAQVVAALAGGATPTLTISSLVDDDLAGSSSEPGDAFYTYEASATLVDPADLEADALAATPAQTFVVGVGSYTGVLENFPTTPGTYYLQVVLKNADGQYSAVAVEQFEIVAPTLALVQTAALGPGNATSGTSHTFTLPGGITDGNKLLAVCVTGANDVTTPPTGWTELHSFAQLGATSNIILWEKTANGDSGATLNFTSTGNCVSCGGFAEISAPAGMVEWATNSADGDPPSLTPSGGNIERVWIAIAVKQRSDGTFTAAPTNYINLVNGLSANPGVNSSLQRACGLATRVLTSSSENPGTFTSGSATKTGAMTIAVW